MVNSEGCDEDKASISRPQWLAVDRQIHRISAGSDDPAGADCGVLSITRALSAVKQPNLPTVPSIATPTEMW
jgi:hypothetical protein